MENRVPRRHYMALEESTVATGKIEEKEETNSSRHRATPGMYEPSLPILLIFIIIPIFFIICIAFNYLFSTLV